MVVMIYVSYLFSVGMSDQSRAGKREYNKESSGTRTTSTLRKSHLIFVCMYIYLHIMFLIIIKLI